MVSLAPMPSTWSDIPKLSGVRLSPNLCHTSDTSMASTSKNYQVFGIGQIRNKIFKDQIFTIFRILWASTLKRYVARPPTVSRSKSTVQSRSMCSWRTASVWRKKNTQINYYWYRRTLQIIVLLTGQSIRARIGGSQATRFRSSNHIRSGVIQQQRSDQHQSDKSTKRGRPTGIYI